MSIANRSDVRTAITPRSEERPLVSGKFLSSGRDKLYIRGVTYGTFKENGNGYCYPSPEVVEADCERIAASGANAIRTYTVPPMSLLDTAWRHGLRVLVGVPWEQHVVVLGDRQRERSVIDAVRRGVRSCERHPALLGYAVGNEIPAGLVRWHGKRVVERFIERLYDAAKSEDPDGLVTYVNYPSTEYLELPCLDFVSFNVYIEAERDLARYVARLHNLSGDRPVVMTEIGIDSRRNGEEGQAQAIEWQLRTSYEGGCAGAFVFSWTDEWHRGGFDISDWDFGLTNRQRRPKPALAAATRVFDALPFNHEPDWPRISVVVCSYNGERCIADCLDALELVDYPDFEVIVVDDGSTDRTAAIARGHAGFRVISTPNQGLSAARNVGLEAATGNIVAYIDDDAYPDSEWLRYLAWCYLTTDHAGVGGPNLPPAGDGLVADCVASAPGGPIHVLVSDTEAEHIPGCNMSFRREALLAIGGFDPTFRVAGDDVDACWRIQENGGTLGFNPAATVWHHRRDSVRTYLRQQRGYGRAEALLERKWPEKYNGMGHFSWTGRLYTDGAVRALFERDARVFHGVWGSALFQSVYQPAPDTLAALPLMPEWHAMALFLCAAGIAGVVWPPLLWLLALGIAAELVALVQAVHGAFKARVPAGYDDARSRFRFRALTAFLHFGQPIARLVGRVQWGLTPWRQRHRERPRSPRPASHALWSERWREPASWLVLLEDGLREDGFVVRRGGDFDRWDLLIKVGALGAMRLVMAIEEHGAGRQLVRVKTRPILSRVAAWPALALALIAGGASLDGAWALSATFAALSVVGVLRGAFQCAVIAGGVRRVWHRLTQLDGAGVVEEQA